MPLFGYFNSSYLLMVFLPTMAITMFAQWKVRSAFAKWNQVPNERGLNGVQTAKLIMDGSNLAHVGVARVPGELTDFYDPRDKSIHLSDGSTGFPSVAAMAVVAHELGHAEQDQTGDVMMRLRAGIVPISQLGTRLGPMLVLVGVVLRGMLGVFGETIAVVGVVLFGAGVLFTLFTLPVEFDASRRAKANLYRLNLVSAGEQKGVSEVLDAAALTYVVAAAAAILQLFYYLSILGVGRRRS